MLRLLENEFRTAYEELEGDDRKRHVSLATGRLAAPTIAKLMERLKGKYPNLKVDVYPIRNDFFGERITVSGLITGQDLKKQLADQELGDVLLLPNNMLRSGEEVFLDDMTVTELAEALQIKVRMVGSAGQDLIHAVLQMEE